MLKNCDLEEIPWIKAPLKLSSFIVADFFFFSDSEGSKTFAGKSVFTLASSLAIADLLLKFHACNRTI
jgi:hypothetical protein